MPELAKQRTAEGAEAFVEYWFDVAEYGYLTGNAESLAFISRPDCDACNAAILNINDEYSAGNRFAEYSISVDYLAAPPLEDLGVQVSFGLTETPLISVDSSGSTSTAAPTVTTPRGTFFAGWQEDHWLAFGIASD